MGSSPIRSVFYCERVFSGFDYLWDYGHFGIKLHPFGALIDRRVYECYFPYGSIGGRFHCLDFINSICRGDSSFIFICCNDVKFIGFKGLTRYVKLYASRVYNRNGYILFTKKLVIYVKKCFSQQTRTGFFSHQNDQNTAKRSLFVVLKHFYRN